MLQQDVAAMRRAAQVMEVLDASPWATILREIATATPSHPVVSLDEQLRWSLVVVVRAAKLARSVLTASAGTAGVDEVSP